MPVKGQATVNSIVKPWSEYGILSYSDKDMVINVDDLDILGNINSNGNFKSSSKIFKLTKMICLEKRISKIGELYFAILFRTPSVSNPHFLCRAMLSIFSLMIADCKVQNLFSSEDIIKCNKINFFP